jgi:hypothetical protein
MRPYLEKCGQRGLDMMTRTASVQVNVDFASAEDLAKKFVVGNRLAPIVGAIFANSPFREGKLSGARSERALVWLNTDADRCGVAVPSIGRRFSMEAWLDSVLSTPCFSCGGAISIVICRRFVLESSRRAHRWPSASDNRLCGSSDDDLYGGPAQAMARTEVGRWRWQGAEPGNPGALEGVALRRDIA